MEELKIEAFSYFKSLCPPHSVFFFLLFFAEEGQDSAKKKHFPKAKLEADWKDPVSAS